MNHSNHKEYSKDEKRLNSIYEKIEINKDLFKSAFLELQSQK